MAAESKEVALVDDPRVIADVLLRVGEMPVEQTEDPEAIQLDIVKRILASKGEEALSQQATTKARDVLDTPLEVRRVKWLRSGLEENPVGVYALIDAVNLVTGEAVLVTCGGQNVLAQLLVLVRDGALPQVVKITQAGETARGYRPLWLERAQAA